MAPSRDDFVNPYLPPTSERHSAAAELPIYGAPLAEPYTRWKAVVLDGLVLTVPVIAILIPVLVFAGLPDMGNLTLTGQKLPILIAGAAAVLWFIGINAYQCWRLSNTGQSLGKAWMRIRIVRLSGEPVGFVSTVLLRSIVPQILSFVPIVGRFFGLVDVLFIFRTDRRCLHDLLAGTRVVCHESVERPSLKR